MSIEVVLRYDAPVYVHVQITGLGRHGGAGHVSKVVVTDEEVTPAEGESLDGAQQKPYVVDGPDEHARLAANIAEAATWPAWSFGA